MVTRRAFIRVLGSSAVVLAAGGLALSQVDQMPEQAIEYVASQVEGFFDTSESLLGAAAP